jgi:hypothetical protein
MIGVASAFDHAPTLGDHRPSPKRLARHVRRRHAVMADATGALDLRLSRRRDAKMERGATAIGHEKPSITMRR